MFGHYQFFSFFFSFFVRTPSTCLSLVIDLCVCRAKDNDKFLALGKTFAFVSGTKEEEEEDLYGFNFVVVLFFLLLLSGGKAF